MRRIFWQGILTNALNLKVALFSPRLRAAVHRCRQHAEGSGVSASRSEIRHERLGVEPVGELLLGRALSRARGEACLFAA